MDYCWFFEGLPWQGGGSFLCFKFFVDFMWTILQLYTLAFCPLHVSLLTLCFMIIYYLKQVPIPGLIHCFHCYTLCRTSFFLFLPTGCLVIEFLYFACYLSHVPNLCCFQYHVTSCLFVIARYNSSIKMTSVFFVLVDVNEEHLGKPKII